MKKEGILAVIFGIFFGGLLGLFLVFQTNQNQLLKNKVISSNQQNNQLVLQKNEIFQPLEINEPNNKTIVNTNNINISGKAQKDSLIVIQSPIKDEVFKNDKTEFKINFPLVRGENVIKIVVYPKNKQFNIQEKNIKIYYLEEEL